MRPVNEIMNDRYQDSRDMSLSARDQYECQVSWAEAEPLSSEEEKKYLGRILRARQDPSNRWLQSLAKDAREHLTEHYQPLVRRLALGYGRFLRGMDFLDLVQEANISLLRAFDTCPFDDLKGSFESWAYASIRMELRKHYQEKNGFVHLNYKIQKGIADIEVVKQRYLQEFGRSPSSDELARELGFSLSRIYELLHYRCLRSPVSTQAICERVDIPEDCHDFQEMYHQFSEVEIVRSDVLALRVEQALSKLPSKHQKVMQFYYGLCGEPCCTPDEVSDFLGMEYRKVVGAAGYGKSLLRTLLAPLYEGREVCA